MEIWRATTDSTDSDPSNRASCLRGINTTQRSKDRYCLLNENENQVAEFLRCQSLFVDSRSLRAWWRPGGIPCFTLTYLSTTCFFLVLQLDSRCSKLWNKHCYDCKVYPLSWFEMSSNLFNVMFSSMKL